MSWTAYLGSIGFFVVLLLVFFSIACSVFLGVHENYRRYYQKADLQWTGAESRIRKSRVPLKWIFAAAVLGSWLIVHFIVMPD